MKKNFKVINVILFALLALCYINPTEGKTRTECLDELNISERMFNNYNIIIQ